VCKKELIMDNGTVVPVSRRLYKEVNEKFIRVVVGE
jgi:DNA-binding LytR/AlgR family response regulator